MDLKSKKASRGIGEAMTKRHILITGGSRGIGASAVRLFAAEGDFVSFIYKENHMAAKALLHSLEEKGYKAEAVCADVTDVSSLREVVSRQRNRIGEIDVLIHNAGISSQKMISDVSEDEFRKIMDTHMTSLFFLSQMVLPNMIREKKGNILAVSSIWGMTGASCEVVYSSAKAAVIGFVKALAKEVGPSGIRVNCVAPGVIDTDMLMDFSAEDKKVLMEETPLQRLGTPEEVAELLFFLASEKASFITGQVISPNGGFLI